MVLPITNSRLTAKMKTQKFEEKSPTSSLQSLLVLYLALVVLAYVAVYYRGHVLGRDFPYNSFLPKPPLFGDFFGPLTEWRAGDLTTSGLGQNYFPSTYLLLDVISTLAKESNLLAISLAVFPSAAIIAFVFERVLRDLSWQGKALTVLLVFTSYPVIFALHTGNLEIWVAALLCVSTLAFDRKAFRLFGFAVGIAASFKVFPAVFLLIPLIHPATNRNIRILFKIFSSSILGLLAPTVLAILLLKGGVKDNGWSTLVLVVDAISRSLEMHKDLMWDTIAGSHFGHSVLNTVHVLFGMDVLPMDQFIIPTIVFGGAITAFLSYLAYTSQKDTWLLWTIPATLACLYVPTSTDYKLIYFLPAVLLMLKSITSNVQGAQLSTFEFFAAVLLVTLFAPKPYGYIGTEPFANATTYATTLAMLFMTVSTFMYFLPASLYTRKGNYREPKGKLESRDKPSFKFENPKK